MENTSGMKISPLVQHLVSRLEVKIRNKVFRRLSDAELRFFRHQHTVDDFEVFLVVTSLLYEAQEAGRC